MTVRRISVGIEPGSYEIAVGAGLLGRINSVVAELSPGRAIILTDKNVAHLHLESIRGAIATSATSLVLPAGEASKSLAMLAQVYDHFAGAGLTRSDLVIGLGGGVVGDLAGFAAATWMRGVRVVQIPTTIEAAIDASIGGKTGVNHAAGKNLIGVFHQPSAVVIDTDFLATLPDRERRAGLAESVKHAVIRDAALLDWHEQHIDAVLAGEPDATVELIAWNCRIKAGVVEQDEREAGLRRILNFGHTIGHALEHLYEYAYRHGECVSLGMVAALRLSESRGGIRDEDCVRVVRLLERIGLPTRLPRPVDTKAVLERVRHDKKVVGGRLHFVLLDGIGRALTATDVSDREVVWGVDQLR